MQINAPLRAGDLPPSQIIRDARDKKIVEQSLRDMSTAPLSPDISNDFSDVHHSVIWTILWVPRAG